MNIFKELASGGLDRDPMFLNKENERENGEEGERIMK